MPFFSASLIKRAENERFFATALAQYAVFRTSAADGTAISLVVAISGRTLGVEPRQTSFGDHQIRLGMRRSSQDAVALNRDYFDIATT